MKVNRSSAVADYRLISRFENLRQKLLVDEHDPRLHKPLAFWALPNDRRLPLVFMDRTIQDLLSTPFDELYSTPGVGQKKIHSLVKLLARAAKDAHHEDDFESDENAERAAQLNDNEGPFDAASVSEASWSQWRATVVRNHMGALPMGRFAPSLDRLPRVLWNTPLERYTELTLHQMRHLKTHGEKRVAAVLEVFHAVHAVAGGLGKQNGLVVRIVPRLAADLDAWVTRTLAEAKIPTARDLRRNLYEPLLAQVRVDTGEQIARLVEGRLAIDGRGATVRQAARDLGLTRARIYQLLADVGEVISVRWPEGQQQMALLSERLHRIAGRRTDLSTFDTAIDIFFPRRPLAAEQTVEGDDHPSRRRAG